MASDFDNYHKWMKKVFPFRLNEKEYELFANYFKKNYFQNFQTINWFKLVIKCMSTDYNHYKSG